MPRRKRSCDWKSDAVDFGNIPVIKMILSHRGVFRSLVHSIEHSIRHRGYDPIPLDTIQGVLDDCYRFNEKVSNIVRDYYDGSPEELPRILRMLKVIPLPPEISESVLKLHKLINFDAISKKLVENNFNADWTDSEYDWVIVAFETSFGDIPIKFEFEIEEGPCVGTVISFSRCTINLPSKLRVREVFEAIYAKDEGEVHVLPSAGENCFVFDDTKCVEDEIVEDILAVVSKQRESVGFLQQFARS